MITEHTVHDATYAPRPIDGAYEFTVLLKSARNGQMKRSDSVLQRKQGVPRSKSACVRRWSTQSFLGERSRNRAFLTSRVLRLFQHFPSSHPSSTGRQTSKSARLESIRLRPEPLLSPPKRDIIKRMCAGRVAGRVVCQVARARVGLILAIRVVYYVGRSFF